MRNRIAAGLNRFARDEGGAITVEAVLWLPFFFALLALITDVSFAFYAKAQAFRIVENGNRAYSVGRLDTVAETRTWIEASLEGFSPNATVTTTESSDLVRTTVIMPADDVMMFSWAGFDEFNLTVRAQHYVESE